MTNKLIDYGFAEEIIKEVEDIFKKKNLTLDEKFLIIKFLNERQSKEKQQDQATQMFSSMPIGGLIGDMAKKLIKKE